MYRILLLGSQGSGKGTQGKLISDQLGIPLVSAGALWRKEITDETVRGRQMEEVLRQGNLASDDWTVELVRKRLTQSDTKNGFILDGYPRNRLQFDLLDALIVPTHVLALTLPDHEAVKRLSGRLICPKCGSNYHVVYNPPQHDYGSGTWFCDEDETMLVIRDDDKPKAVQHRLDIYHRETEPLLELYESRGILHKIDAMSSIEKVHADIMQLLTS